MSSNSRSRSISRSRVVKLSEVVPSGEVLDPIALLSDLLPHVNDLDIPLVVTISDTIQKVSFLLSIFIQKEYEVSGHSVNFGFKKIDLHDLKVNISFDLNVINDDEN